MSNLARIEILVFTFCTFGAPLASLLSRDIMPSEDEHLVFVIRGETHKLGR